MAALRRLSQIPIAKIMRSEEHTSELQSRLHLVCRLLLEKKKEQNSLLPVRLLRGQTWLAGIVILLLCSNTFPGSDFLSLWSTCKVSVISCDEVPVSGLTQ